MTNNKWVVDVLGDIAAFAEKNGLSGTYDAVLNSMLTANEEIDQNQLESELVARTSSPVIHLRRVT